MGEIQTQTDPNQWRYVPTKVNPADMLSRGMLANDLAKCNSWWRGPAFLSHTKEVASGAERRTRWRGCPSHLTGYAARELAPGQSPRSLPRGRRTGPCGQGSGRGRHLDTASDEAVSSGRRVVHRNTDKDLMNS